MAGTVAHAGPEDDRKQMVSHFKSKLPAVKYENYIYGALALDKDSKSQYDSIMEFPPFEGVIEAGKEMWKSHSRMARPLPVASPMVARTWPGITPVLMHP